MKQTDLQKENKKLKRINFILIIYVVISIVRGCKLNCVSKE